MHFELYSKRKRKKEQSEQADIYQYDTVPKTLRVQLQQILRDSIGPQYRPDPYGLARTVSDNSDGWRLIHKILCKEMGVHRLASEDLEFLQVLDLIGNAEVESFLDTIDVCVRYIHNILKPLPDYRLQQRGISQEPADAINEINYRFREANLGFQFEEGEIFRIDSEFVHEEVIKPALKILSEPGFEGPRSEFIDAHACYRAGDNEQAVVLAANAFESTLKVACDRKGWEYPKGARASDLLKVIRKNGLWPEYLDASFDQLLATLTSGLPKVRNDNGAHGQGREVRVTPTYIASYALHLSAAKIILVSKALLSD